MGLAIALGSFGQVLIPPAVDALVARDGVVAALGVMAALAVLMAPLALGLGEGRGPVAAVPPPPPRAALAAAWANPGYRRLVIGFFACGFQLAFISLHLPGHLVLCGQPAAAGGWALAVMGACNVFGCWLFGQLGGRHPPARLLALIYALRAVTLAGFVVLPVSLGSLLIFSALTGLTWLATVPLTSALIARLCGVQALGLLFGVAFLSHQLGSFAGALAGGWAFDATGSYTAVWALAGLLGLIAALLHGSIAEPPPEPAVAAGATNV
jgi:predicted MFS family arabinose efflux permease